MTEDLQPAIRELIREAKQYVDSVRKRTQELENSEVQPTYIVVQLVGIINIIDFLASIAGV